MPWAYWRVSLAKTFGCSPAQVDDWEALDVYEAITVLNAINKAGGGTI